MDEQRYRETEQRLWDSVGREPTERRVTLACTGTEVRVQEVGSGEPALFIHGGPNSGSTWAPLLEHLHGFRCLLVDRPGTGLSEPFPLTPQNLESVGARFVSDLLDALQLDRVHVVASSFGGHLALRSAAADPGRLRRMVQMAAPALVPGQTIPPFMKLLRYRPVRAAMNVLPPSDRANRSIMRQIGHGASLDAGRLPEAHFDWYLALARHTETMRNDGAMIGEALSRRDELTLTEQLLSQVTTPTLFLWGVDDGFGGVDNARRTVAPMPDAELVTIEESGHLPWLDFPAYVAEATAAFLRSQDVVAPPQGRGDHVASAAASTG